MLHHEGAAASAPWSWYYCVRTAFQGHRRPSAKCEWERILNKERSGASAGEVLASVRWDGWGSLCIRPKVLRARSHFGRHSRCSRSLRRRSQHPQKAGRGTKPMLRTHFTDGWPLYLHPILLQQHYSSPQHKAPCGWRWPVDDRRVR